MANWQRFGAGVAVGGASFALLLGPSSSALAAEVTPRPQDGVLHLRGHGFGHGRGMSQWGAYGAAQVGGLSWTQILDFYYPGTARSPLAPDVLKVWISGDTDGNTTVLPAEGLRASSAGTTVTLPAGNGYRAWRAVRNAAATALVLQFKDAAGTWRAWPQPSANPAPAPAPTPAPAPAPNFPASSDVAFAATGTVRLVLPSGRQQELRGSVHSVLVSSSVRTLLHSSMESYLRGVVPNEMPASWHVEALAAQSVAARTYAAAYRKKQRARGSFYDVCDTIVCQVFSGVATYDAAGGGRVPREDVRATQAIGKTSGTVLRTSSAGDAPLAYTEFSASNGGWTTSGGVSYLVAKRDPYDGAIPNGSHTWYSTVRSSSLESAFSLGRLVRVVVPSRDGRGAEGGRPESVRLVGTDRTVTTSGTALRRLLGLKSDWFAVTDVVDRPRDVTGDGVADVLMRDAAGRLLRASGTASAAFTAPAVMGTGWQAFDAVVAVGQWDGAGAQDLIVRRSADKSLILYSRSSVGWLKPRVIGVGYRGYRAFVGLGDVTGDGRPDLGAINPSGKVVVIPQVARGLVGKPYAVGSGTSYTHLVAPGDITGDARGDLVAVTTAGALVRMPLSATSVGAPVTIGTGWKGYAAVWSVGDATDDARADLLALTTRGDVRRFRGNGNGTFAFDSVILRGLAGATPVS